MEPPANQGDRDYEAYKALLDLWSRENPIKTTKLQMLLAVNALLVSVVNFTSTTAVPRWYLYLAGGVFSLIWMFSIGRTSLFQDVWQIKIADLRRRHPNDPRFAALETDDALRRARPLLRLFGAIPSKWYLLFSPFLFAVGWLVALVVALAR
ncbi:MAG TPA: hypothetical protein VGU22_10765 [Methylomirabilota bacterium]|jgi:hypothetical protein|nr:hypothetical protein [Methylomirabilota bacterium]